MLSSYHSCTPLSTTDPTVHYEIPVEDLATIFLGISWGRKHVA
jgi:hypothetical protein